jgi:hypothetical protein
MRLADCPLPTDFRIELSPGNAGARVELKSGRQRLVDTLPVQSRTQACSNGNERIFSLAKLP